MAHAVMTSMMAKIDELKEQMTDGAYLALCDELMRLHASTPPDAPATPPDAPATPPEAPATPPISEERVMEWARELADDARRDWPDMPDGIFDLNDPGFIDQVREALRAN